ncbi:alpha/beta hydrolase [Roseateles puraquae]|uniref:alpha/beta fold hydrolase n=1 Tax=Roseateles puraquae TaxID=431059 RepID=UPI0031D78C4F
MNPIDRNHVRRIGDQGPVLLYAHGFGCHQGMWAGITPAFEASHQQILMDYTGSGPATAAAPFDTQRYGRLDGYAQDLIEVCDALGLTEGVTLVAHSVSCSIGMLAHLQRPALFERMILIGPSPCFLNHPPDYLGGFEAADLEGLLQLMDQNYLGWASYLAPVVAGAEAAVAGAELEQSFCSTDPQTARVFARATFFADNRADLPKVRCPSLILQHAQDALAPQAVGQYLHRELADSRYELLDVAGHCAHMSHPALVIDAMRRYLAETPVSR